MSEEQQHSGQCEGGHAENDAPAWPPPATPDLSGPVSSASTREPPVAHRMLGYARASIAGVFVSLALLLGNGWCWAKIGSFGHVWLVDLLARPVAGFFLSDLTFAGLNVAAVVYVIRRKTFKPCTWFFILVLIVSSLLLERVMWIISHSRVYL